MRKDGVDVGLINKVAPPHHHPHHHSHHYPHHHPPPPPPPPKVHLNVVDEDVISLIGKTPVVLVVEPLNRKTGLGVRFGTDLLKRGLHPK